MEGVPPVFCLRQRIFLSDSDANVTRKKGTDCPAGNGKTILEFKVWPGRGQKISATC